jgi:hypothetical protein
MSTKRIAWALAMGSALLVISPGVASSRAAKNAGAETVESLTPVQSSRTFYVRRTGCDADQRLSIVRGDETVGCLHNLGIMPSPLDYSAYDDGIPLTLDATRRLTGVITYGNWWRPLGNVEASVGAGLITLRVEVFGTLFDGESMMLGSHRTSYVATPLQHRYDTPFSIALPTGADKREFAGLTLRVTLGGASLLHGAAIPNDTNMTVPIWTTEEA